MKQLTLFPVRQDPNTFTRGIARCRAALTLAVEHAFVYDGVQQESAPAPRERPGAWQTPRTSRSPQ